MAEASSFLFLLYYGYLPSSLTPIWSCLLMLCLLDFAPPHARTLTIVTCNAQHSRRHMSRVAWPSTACTSCPVFAPNIMLLLSYLLHFPFCLSSCNPHIPRSCQFARSFHGAEWSWILSNGGNTHFENAHVSESSLPWFYSTFSRSPSPWTRSWSATHFSPARRHWKATEWLWTARTGHVWAQTAAWTPMLGSFLSRPRGLCTSCLLHCEQEKRWRQTSLITRFCLILESCCMRFVFSRVYIIPCQKNWVKSLRSRFLPLTINLLIVDESHLTCPSISLLKYEIYMKQNTYANRICCAQATSRSRVRLLLFFIMYT